MSALRENHTFLMAMLALFASGCAGSHAGGRGDAGPGLEHDSGPGVSNDAGSDTGPSVATDAGDAGSERADAGSDSGPPEVCAGVVCDPPTACHAAATCDPSTGRCVYAALTDGSACDDGNACTQHDACTRGACTGGAPVVCTAADVCHVAGTCNPSTGACSTVAAPDATACNDGNACTTHDECRSGGCVGMAPVVCMAADACHVAGTCNPATGMCSVVAAPEASHCDDGNACTHRDECRAGACQGFDAVVCTALDTCHVAGACDHTSGTCSNPNAATGTLCDDSSMCTTSDSCTAGACGGATRVCDDANPCTTDRCDASTGCAATPTPGLCAAPTGLRLVHADLVGGLTHFTLAWERSTTPTVSGYRVERSATSSGPWTAVTTVPQTTQTFVDPTGFTSESVYYRLVALAGAFDGDLTSPVRAYAISSITYDLPSQTVPGIAFATRLRGIVRYPTTLTRGPFPLVLILHGNHGVCRDSGGNDLCPTDPNLPCPAGYSTTPNAEGHIYLAETLAAHGVVAATIDANALNCRNTAILARASLLTEHLRRWHGWTTGSAAPFGALFTGAVDMSRVGLSGHSRGGDAVGHTPDSVHAAQAGGDPALSGVALRGVFAIAPTDFALDASTGIPTADLTTTPYAVILPSCDGDVCNLQGMFTFDRNLAARTQLRSQLYLIGADHNQFNTSWPAETASCSVTPVLARVNQQYALEATIASFFDSLLAPAPAPLEPYLRAEGTVPSGISAYAMHTLDLRRAHLAASRLLVDDVEGGGAGSTDDLSQPVSVAGYSSTRGCFQNACDTDFDDSKGAMFLSWSGGAPVASWGTGDLDVSTYAELSMRVAERYDPLNPAGADQDFHIRIADTSGHVATVLASTVQRVPYPLGEVPSCGAGTPPRELLHSVRVPLASLAAANATLNLHHIASVGVDMSAPGHATGSVLVSDLEISQ